MGGFSIPLAFVWTLLHACLNSHRAAATGMPTANGVYTFELCGGRSQCSKKPEFLGFNNKTCDAGVPPNSSFYGNTVGPLLRGTNGESNLWRWWKVKVTTSTGATFATIQNAFPSGKGKPKCLGYYMTDYYRYRNKKACKQPPWAMRVHLHKKSHPWQFIPVQGTDCFNIVDSGKPKRCLRYLSASSSCEEKYMHLTASDDGSGLQRWRIIKNNPPTPPTPRPSPPAKMHSPPPPNSPISPPPAIKITYPLLLSVSASSMHTGSVVFQPSLGALSCTVSVSKDGESIQTSTINSLSYPQTVFYPVNLDANSDYTVNLKCKLSTEKVVSAPTAKILSTPPNNSHPTVINFVPTSTTSGNLTVVPPDPEACKPLLYDVHVTPKAGGPTETTSSDLKLISIDGLTPGLTYVVVVDAICADGTTTKSSEALYLTPPPPSTPQSPPPPGKSPPGKTPPPPSNIQECTQAPELAVVAVTGSIVTVQVKAPPPIDKSQVAIAIACKYDDGTESGDDSSKWIPASNPITSIQSHVNGPGSCEVVVAVQQLGQVVPVLCPIEDATFKITSTQITPGLQNVQATSSGALSFQIVEPTLRCQGMSYIVTASPADPLAQAVSMTVTKLSDTMTGLTPGSEYMVSTFGKCLDGSQTPPSQTFTVDVPCNTNANFDSTPVNSKCVCAAGYQLSSDGKCIESKPCPVGQYRDPVGNTCINCSPLPGCATVSCQSASTSICVACNSGLVLDKKTGQCVGSCGPGSFLDGTVCKNCTAVPGCLPFSVSCSNATSSKCFKCSDGYYLDSAGAGVCVQCSSISKCVGSLTCSSVADSVCSKCASGYYGSQCFECVRSAGCTATSNLTCSSNNDTKCDACSPGYYSSSNGCAPCTSSTINGCIKYACSSATVSTCSECSLLFDLNAAGTCDKKASCPVGQYRSPADGTCTPCTSTGITHCAQYSCTSSTDSICTACDSGYTLSGNTCVPSSPAAPSCSAVTFFAEFASYEPVNFYIKLPGCSTTMTTATCISMLINNNQDQFNDLKPGCGGYIILCEVVPGADKYYKATLFSRIAPVPGQMIVEAEYSGGSTNQYGIGAHFNKAGKPLLPDISACGSINPPFNVPDNTNTAFLGPCPGVGGGSGRVQLPPTDISCS